MIRLYFEIGVSNIRQTPFASLFIVIALSIGIGVTTTLMTVYHHSNENPIPEESESIYRVALDNFDYGSSFNKNQPDDPAWFLTYKDTFALMESDVPSQQAAMYSNDALIMPTDNNSGVSPFRASIRITSYGFFNLFRVPFQYGSSWGVDEDQGKLSVAVISKKTNERLFGGGDSIGKTLKIRGIGLRVIGVLDEWSFSPRAYDMSTPFAQVEDVFVPLSAFESNIGPSQWRRATEVSFDKLLGFDQLFKTSENVFFQYWVKLSTDDQKASYLTFLDNYVQQEKVLGRFPKPMNNQIFTLTQWIKMEQRETNSGIKAVFVIAILFLSVCVFNTVSLLLSKFLAGVSQISVLRAIGARRIDIFFQYMVEVSLLGLAAGVLGVGFAKLGLVSTRELYVRVLPKDIQSMVDSSGLSFLQLDASMIAMSFLLALSAALVVAIYPAWRLSRIIPVEYLRLQ